MGSLGKSATVLPNFEPCNSNNDLHGKMSRGCNRGRNVMEVTICLLIGFMAHSTEENICLYCTSGCEPIVEELRGPRGGMYNC